LGAITAQRINLSLRHSERESARRHNAEER
jgi:hypothetical protein